MFYVLFTLLYVHSSIAIILMGKRELIAIALLNLSSWCLVMVERLFLTVPRGCLRFVIVVFTDHTHLLFLLGCCGLLKYCMMGRKVIYVRLINCSYNNVAKGIRLLDNKHFCLYRKVRAFERYIP